MGDLSDPDPSVRGRAIRNIILFGDSAHDGVPLIIKCTRDGDVSVRIKAVMALKVMGIRGTDIPRVVEALGHRISGQTEGQSIVRYEAAQALMRFTDDTRAVIPELVKGVSDTGAWEIREACIMALRSAGVDPKKGPDTRVTEALLTRLNPVAEPSSLVRLQAIIALGGQGRPQDPRLLGRVISAIKSDANWKSRHKPIRLWSHVALMALEDKINEGYLKVVAEYLKDHDREMRVQAVGALGAIGGKARSYVPNILDMLRDKELLVRMTACAALAHMDDHSDRVLKGLTNVMLQSGLREDLPQVIAAANALAEIGVANNDVTDAFQKVLERKNLEENERKMIEKALEKLQKPKKRPAR
jgi:HEAT repeat protein